MGILIISILAAINYTGNIYDQDIPETPKQNSSVDKKLEKIAQELNVLIIYIEEVIATIKKNQEEEFIYIQK